MKKRKRLRKVVAALGLAVFIYLVVGLFVEIAFGVGALLSIFRTTPESVAITCAFLFVVALLIGLVIWKKL